MSRIADRINEIKSAQGMEEFLEKKKVSITIRVEDFTLHCIDKLVNEIGGTRSGVAHEMVSEGVLDALEGLGYNLDDLQKVYWEEFKSQKEAK